MAKRKLDKKKILYCRWTIYFFKTIGLAPVVVDFTIKKDNKNNNNLELLLMRFESTKFCITYNVVLTILVAILNTFGILVPHGRGVYRLEFDHLIEVTGDTFGTVTAVYVLIYNCVKREKIIKIAMKISNLVNILRKEGYDDVDDDKRINGLWMLKEFYLTMGISWFLIVSTTPMLPIDFMILFTLTDLSVLVICGTLMLYGLTLKILLHLLKIVNANFKQFYRETTANFNKNYVYVKNITYNGDKNNIDSVLRLREIFWSLCELSESVNDFFATPVLMCVAYVFEILIVYLYFLIKPMVVEKNLLTSSILIRSFFEIVILIVSMVFLTKSVTTFLRQVN